ncbi:alpha-glucosidase [Vibrio metschnikovii]|uniref:glycoside hydrolase family 13 protein n=1 Tax=Vibrio metschnikovii TaxID=28172 RepID=UPI00315C94DE
MDQKWWHDAVVYQIYPRSFNDSNNDGIGDIFGITQKLDYLADLGINVIWLSPVYESPMDDNGYDISHYQKIAQEYGTMQDMEQLFKEADKREIRVVMDLVVNHTSVQHEWFLNAKQSKDNPYRDYYIWRDPKPDGSEPDDTQSLFGGSAWQWDENSQQYYFHLFSKRQPDLNWENETVRQEIYNMINWWIDRGIGGFRLDVIDLIGKEIDKGILGNGPNLHPFLKEMNQKTFRSKDLLTVGETWGATPEIAKLYSHPDRHELSMIFQFEHITLSWQNGDKWNPIPFNTKKFKEIITKWQVELSDQGWNSLFLNNHDLPRAVSNFGNDKKYRVESAKMLATCLHFLKGTPYIYQGEEIGMTNVVFDDIDQYRDIETLNYYKLKTESGVSHQCMMEAIYKNSRDNARTPMQWDASLSAGFSQGTPWIQVNQNYKLINVKSAIDDKDSIFYHYQKLISLRKQLPTIVYGSFTSVDIEDDRVFSYIRDDENSTILVINNLSADKVKVSLPEAYSGKSGICLIFNYHEYNSIDTQLELNPYESFALQFPKRD